MHSFFLATKQIDMWYISWNIHLTSKHSKKVNDKCIWLIMYHFLFICSCSCALIANGRDNAPPTKCLWKKMGLRNSLRILKQESSRVCWKITSVFFLLQIKEFQHLRKIFKSGSFFRFALLYESASFPLSCPCFPFSSTAPLSFEY